MKRLIFKVATAIESAKIYLKCLTFRRFESHLPLTANNLDDVKTVKIRRLKISNNLDTVPKVSWYHPEHIIKIINRAI